MCQLTYSNLHDPYLNSLMVYFLSTIGSEKHDDGCGIICSDNTIWKTEKPANKISNLGTILDQVIRDNKPVPFHIRMATYGIEITQENAHPFDGKHFILMHNGTLLPRNGEEPKDKKKDSDSLKFLMALDGAKDKKPKSTFKEIFNHAMENFAGKFAFIIREKETGKDFIIRGRTAELWITNIKQDDKSIGYVINTNDLTLKSALFQFLNVASLMNSNKYECSEPVLLKAETIFLAEDMNIKEIGITIEFTPVVKKEEKAIVPFVRDRENFKRDKSADIILSSDIGKIIRVSVKIYEFLDSHCMSLLDLQTMFKMMGGISLLEVTKEDLDMFVDYMIPKICANKALRVQVRKILNAGLFPKEAYKIGKLEYPWCVNDSKTVLDALKEYIK